MAWRRQVRLLRRCKIAWIYTEFAFLQLQYSETWWSWWIQTRDGRIATAGHCEIRRFSRLLMILSFLLETKLKFIKMCDFHYFCCTWRESVGYFIRSLLTCTKTGSVQGRRYHICMVYYIILFCLQHSELIYFFFCSFVINQSYILLSWWCKKSQKKT